MAKSEVPTSTYIVYCDEYDTSLKVSYHKVRSPLGDLFDKQKLLFTMKTADGDEINLSLFKEDIQLLSLFGVAASSKTDNRGQ